MNVEPKPIGYGMESYDFVRADSEAEFRRSFDIH